MQPNEGIRESSPLLKLETSDEELVSQVNGSIDRAKPLYSKVRVRAEDNLKYWKGEQLDLSKLKDHQAKIVNNIIFRDMETMLPIITQNPPLPKLLSSSKEFDKSIQKILRSRWEVQDGMLDKNRKLVRSNFLELLGALKYRWDKDTNDFVWEFVKQKNLMIDGEASDIDSLEYVAEYINDFTLQQILDRWSDKKDEILKDLGVLPSDNDRLGAKTTFVEFNTPNFTVWKLNNVILDKQKNPNWDWGNETKVDEEGNEITVGYNLFKKPRVPYIFFTTFNLGNSLYADTSLIEQSKKLQDGVNKRKRQISDNADDANGVLVGSGMGISKDEFSKIDDEPGLKVWISEGNVNQVLGRIPGNQLPQYVYQDMIHSESAMDSIWGTHEITRGSGEADTATQDVMQQKQDFGRIDDIVKAYEDVNEQYFQACFQMMLIHYTDEHVYSFEDEDDLVISRQSIIDAYSKSIKRRMTPAGEVEEVKEGDFRPPIIMVKRGSTLPTDDTSRRNEALMLAKMQKISDIDLYEKLDFANPREMAYRSFLQASNPQQLYSDMAPSKSNDSTEAMRDYEMIVQGQEVQPNNEVQNPQSAEVHITSHNKQIDSPEFQQLPPEVQQLLVDHIKGEIGIVKQTLNNQNTEEVVQ